MYDTSFPHDEQHHSHEHDGVTPDQTRRSRCGWLDVKPPDPVSVLPLPEYPHPTQFRGLLYIAAPLTIYSTARYDHALDEIATAFRGASLFTPRHEFRSNAEWRAWWEHSHGIIRGLVVVTDADGWIGLGVLKETSDVLGLRRPVWVLRGPLTPPYDEWPRDEHRRRVKPYDWPRDVLGWRTNPCRFVPFPLATVEVEGRDPRRWARVHIPDEATLRETMPVHGSQAALRLVKHLAHEHGFDPREFWGGVSNTYLTVAHVQQYAVLMGIDSPALRASKPRYRDRHQRGESLANEAAVIATLGVLELPPEERNESVTFDFSASAQTETFDGGS